MPLEALRWDVTPLGLHYLLIHYDIPAVDPATWRLEVGGRVDRELSLSLEDLRAPAGRDARGDDGVRGQRARAAGAAHRLASRGCWRRSAPPSGRACRSRDLLYEAGVAGDAVEILFTGLDRGVEGGVEQAYQRSLTLAEASDGPLLAYAINGEPLPPQHGFPLRLVVPGWYGMTSVKWLARIDAIAEPFDGYQQADGLPDPRARGRPGHAGHADHAARADGPAGDPGLHDAAAVRSRRARASCAGARGRAGARSRRSRSRPTAAATWAEAGLGAEPEPGRVARRGRSPGTREPGEHELCCRARDAAGNAQPVDADWNVGGYANTSVQRVPVTVA